MGTRSSRQRVILDLDTGIDDALALAYVLGSPEVELEAVVCSYGNVTVDTAVRNTHALLELLGRPDVPVYRGADRALSAAEAFVPPAGVTRIHGENGLGNVELPASAKKPLAEDAVTSMRRWIEASPRPVTIAAVGPLTNIAMAIRLAPEILPKIRQIVLMGGAYGLGNTTPAAEFNLFADPEAAHIVFSSGVPLVMMGLDLTNQTVCTMDIIERMEALGNRAGKLFGEIMRFTFKTQQEVNGLAAGPVHDVTCVAWLVAPELFTLQPAHVEIDLSHGPCYGRTVCDFVMRDGLQPNCRVGITLDRERFWDLVAETLARYE